MSEPGAETWTTRERCGRLAIGRLRAHGRPVLGRGHHDRGDHPGGGGTPSSAPSFRTSYRTRKAEHGTEYLHKIRYEDVSDSNIDGTAHVWGYDIEHATERFYEGDEGFRIKGERRPDWRTGRRSLMRRRMGGRARTRRG